VGKLSVDGGAAKGPGMTAPPAGAHETPGAPGLEVCADLDGRTAAPTSFYDDSKSFRYEQPSSRSGPLYPSSGLHRSINAQSQNGRKGAFALDHVGHPFDLRRGHDRMKRELTLSEANRFKGEALEA
jgi:hypothetical protein